MGKSNGNVVNLFFYQGVFYPTQIFF